MPRWTPYPPEVSNCGACGYTCPAAPVGATARCVAGVCGISALSCPAGTGNCDGRDDNGCETTTTADVLNCGTGGATSAGCGHACPSAGGTASCAAGACSLTCDTGRGDCDSNAANGCETDTTTSNAHCGTCGHACVALMHCVAGSCSL